MNMDFRRILLALILILACARFLCAEETLPSKAAAIPVGEHLIYKVSWLGIPVGTGEIFAKEKILLNGREVFHIVGKVETNRVLSKIFPMHDEAHSWIDAKTLESVQFEKKVNELFIKAHERMTFDRSKKKGYYESFKTGLKKEFSIQVPVHDVFSAFYWIRRQELTPGKSFKTTLSCDQKDWALTLDGIHNETIKWKGKEWNTLHVEPWTVVEKIEKKNMAWFSITRDASHIPIRIVFKASFGYMVGVLKNDAFALPS